MTPRQLETKRCPDCGHLVELPVGERCRICVARQMNAGKKRFSKDNDSKIELELPQSALNDLKRIRERHKRKGSPQ